MSDNRDVVPVVVCKHGEIAEGRIKVFKVDGTEGIVIRIGDTYRACQRYCSHEKFPLEFGRLRDANTLCCTYHGAEFDLTTGEVKKLPAFKGIAIYQVRIEGDDVVVEIPR
jgi:3-phenylpropionate/trans-cinnamate dioxygenase ferredoxin subunit